MVKSFSTQKGWGMIFCNHTLDMYGKDMFFSRQAFLARTEPSAGMEVQFTVGEGRNGKIEAQGVTPLSGATRGPLVPTTAQPRGGAMKSSSAVVGTEERRCGTVKSFNEEKGWGHISSDALRQIYGKDVFLMRSALDGQTVTSGTQVIFTPHIVDKGPQAKDVTVIPPGTFSSEDTQGKQFSGTIKSFKEEKGWGFVTSPAISQLFGKDLFIHKRELNGLDPEPGLQVRFTVHLNEASRPEARELVAAGAVGYQAVRAQPTSRHGKPY